MADTVKKSRIVSDDCLSDNTTEDNSSLQDIINEEFNQRLKTCMKNVCIYIGKTIYCVGNEIWARDVILQNCIRDLWSIT